MVVEGHVGKTFSDDTQNERNEKEMKLLKASALIVTCNKHKSLENENRQ